MDSGLTALGGTIIGGVCVIIATIITQLYAIKTEKRRLKQSHLSEKKSIIESVIVQRSDFFYIGNLEQDSNNYNDDFKIIAHFVDKYSHYFHGNPKTEELKKNIDFTRCVIDQAFPPFDDIDEDLKKVVDLFNSIIKEELDSTMNELDKLMKC